MIDNGHPSKHREHDSGKPGPANKKSFFDLVYAIRAFKNQTKKPLCIVELMY